MVKKWVSILLKMNDLVWVPLHTHTHTLYVWKVWRQFYEKYFSFPKNQSSTCAHIKFYRNIYNAFCRVRHGCRYGDCIYIYCIDGEKVLFIYIYVLYTLVKCTLRGSSPFYHKKRKQPKKWQRLAIVFTITIYKKFCALSKK